MHSVGPKGSAIMLKLIASTLAGFLVLVAPAG
jgi:hypothetical protein